MKHVPHKYSITAEHGTFHYCLEQKCRTTQTVDHGLIHHTKPSVVNHKTPKNRNIFQTECLQPDSSKYLLLSNVVVIGLEQISWKQFSISQAALRIEATELLAEDMLSLKFKELHIMIPSVYFFK